MEDDHVDRTGVEAWQHVKLTVTNSSIDFIVLIACVHLLCPDARKCAPDGLRRKVGDGLPACMGNPIAGWKRMRKAKHCIHSNKNEVQPRQLLMIGFALCRPGGSGGVAAPVPIPNTAVKRPSADGTLS